MSDLTTFVRRVRRLDLAIRALVVLDGAGQAHPVKLGQVLDEVPTPAKFTSTVLGSLSRSGMVASTRGSHGGYWLTRPLAEITVLEVMEAIGPSEGETVDEPPLEVLGEVWAAIDADAHQALSTMTLADVAPSVTG